MQLCVGTSIAIVVPTTIRSYLTHRAKGASHSRRDPAMGVACGDRRCLQRGDCELRAGGRVELALRLVASFHRGKLLFAGDRWNLGTELPGPLPMTLYGFGIGLSWIADGRERRLAFEHRAYALRQADPQCGRDSSGSACRSRSSATIGLRARRPAAPGLVAAALDRLRVADRTCRDRRRSRATLRRTARRLAHRLSRRRSKSRSACFLLRCRCASWSACSDLSFGARLQPRAWNR